MVIKTKCLHLPQLKQKDNENNAHKYILVVAPVTTPTVVKGAVLVCIYVNII